jgi:tripartite-type tricarboxylate transporter receptor subunit TctC
VERQLWRQCGGTDSVARVISQPLAERLGQQIIIDNRGGANAIVGTAIAAKAPPDGYTMLLCLPASIAVNPGLYSQLPYDPQRDFEPVIRLSITSQLLTTHPVLPVKTINDLIQLARARPGTINYGSSGFGSAAHLVVELLRGMAQIDIVHVPYKGGGLALNDLIAGQIQLMSGPAIAALPFVKSGRLRALGVTTAKRVPMLPDVPTIGETLPGYEITGWLGVMVPQGTSPEIVARLNREIGHVLQIPAVREHLASQGSEPIGGSPAEFKAVIGAEMRKYAALLKNAGIKPENWSGR